MQGLLFFGLGLLLGISACGSSKDDSPASAGSKKSVQKNDTMPGDAISGAAQTETLEQHGKHTPAPKEKAGSDRAALWLNPLVHEILASSHFFKHPPGHVLDGINQTTWNARGDAPGKEWLEFKFETPQSISTIVINTGWEKMSRKWESLFYGNSRAQKVKLFLNGRQVAVKSGGRHVRRLVFDNIDETATSIKLVFAQNASGYQWSQLTVSDVDIWRGQPGQIKRATPCAVPLNVDGIYVAHDVRDQDILATLFPAYNRISGRVAGAQTCLGERINDFDGLFPIDERDLRDYGWDAKNYPIVGYRQNLDDGRLMAYVITYREVSEEAGALVLAEYKNGTLSILPGINWAATMDAERVATHHVLSGRDVWAVPYGREDIGSRTKNYGDAVWVQLADRMALAGKYETRADEQLIGDQRGMLHFTSKIRWRPNALQAIDAVTVDCTDDNGETVNTLEYNRSYMYQLAGNRLIKTHEDHGGEPRCD